MTTFTRENSGCLMIEDFIKQPPMSRNNRTLPKLQTSGYERSIEAIIESRAGLFRDTRRWCLLENDSSIRVYPGSEFIRGGKAEKTAFPAQTGPESANCASNQVRSGLVGRINRAILEMIEAPASARGGRFIRQREPEITSLCAQAQPQRADGTVNFKGTGCGVQ